jgi:hypothetical protein
MAIDLNTCIPGQNVKLRHGKIVEYIEPIKDDRDTTYEHLVDFCYYMNDGCYWEDRRTSDMDIVEILPLETTESTKDDKHPSVAWWESCPWITDRLPIEEDGDSLNQVMMKGEGTRATLYFKRWQNVESDEAWIHCLNWNAPEQTPREQALELLNKHEGGWCPTPKEWTIIRKGLEEST